MKDYTLAIQDFRRAHSRAALQRLLARITGNSTELLSYEEVRQSIRAGGVMSHTLREIPLDAIVGSVGRYQDFTRGFLPTRESDADRWARVRVATSSQSGLPPVELYQIGGVYFVHDGHHRVSVARQLGAKVIQAYVTQIRSKVPLSPDIQPDDLIVKAEYVDFLEQTGLDVVRPGADMSVTAAGQYQRLLEHIEVHRHYMGLEQQREVPYQEAVTHWYDAVYLPVVEIIRELGILRGFPARSETDLYLWIGKHRADLEEALGWQIPESAAAIDLVQQHGRSTASFASRIGRMVLDVVAPGETEPSLTASLWRPERTAVDSSARLFRDVLVALDGGDGGWLALEAAIMIAGREGGRLLGLHVMDDDEQAESEEVHGVRDRFIWRCGEMELPGELALEVGPVARTICGRSRWVDLVVVSLEHPPGPSPLAKLGSGFRTILKHCARPVLAVPASGNGLSRPLLAYDDGPKSQEALYVTAYLAGRWKVPVTVLTVGESGEGAKTLTKAQRYLEELGISADYVASSGPVAETIVDTVDERGCDFLVLGGYGGGSVAEVILGSVLDKVLAHSCKPVLICP